jgi:tRNA A-37 threonylcarbamoyl transferase component Bud32
MIGKIIGNYRIVEKIGEGGMGAVYRAVDLMLEREVAIKAIRPELARDDEIVARFRTEARILARIHHPAIATIYSFFDAGDDLFLAMEFVHGRSLARVLQQQSALPWQRAVSLLAAAMGGIEQAHRQGIVHRDLKPENLMITDAGEVKVMDFGIARATGSSRLTRTGLLVGTLRYMAPEQIRGEEVDQRTDIYALGAVLYEMLTGRVPFDDGSDYAVLKAHVEENPRAPILAVPDLPQWLDRATLRALAKDPDDRFQTVEQMRLCLLQQSEPAGREPDPNLTRIQRGESIASLPTVVRTPAPAAPAPDLAAGSSSSLTLGNGSRRQALLAAGLTAAAVVAAIAAAVLWLGRGGAQPAAILKGSGARQDSHVSIQAAATAATGVTGARGASPEGGGESTAGMVATGKRKRSLAPGPPASGSTAGETGGQPPDLKRLAAELEKESGEIRHLYGDFLGQKAHRGVRFSADEIRLREQLGELQTAAERFSLLFKSGFFARARARLGRLGHPSDERGQIVRRCKTLSEKGASVEDLVARVTPSPPVRELWQQMRRATRQAASLCGG